MVHSPRRLTASAVVIGVLAAGSALVACSKSTPAGGTATVPTAPPTTADQWAVPATITPDYLNRVLAKLNQIDGDAVRDARRVNAITPNFKSLESSIRATPHEEQLAEKLWSTTIGAGWPQINAVPGDRKSSVTQIIDASSACVFARVDEDFSAEGNGSGNRFPAWFVGLVSHTPTVENPTHWAFIYDGYESSGGTPHNPCSHDA